MSAKSKRIAELISRAREDAGMSQAELARRSGTSQAALSAIEHGARVPSDSLAERILAAADLRPSVPVSVYAADLKRIAAEHGLHDVRVFGSIVRGDDTAESDVDVLATRDPGVSALRVLAFPAKAQELLGFPVDLLLDDSPGAAVSAIRAESVPL